MNQSRKRSTSCRGNETPDLFDGLPDDIVVCILCKLTSSASQPSDFFNILITCKRLNRLALHRLVLSRAGAKTIVGRAKTWSDSAHWFLKRCVNAGNTEACFILGMIRFYCLQNRRSGASLMAKAAMKSHAPALYSLCVIQFNGSGGSKADRNLQAGLSLCARAADLGYVDALRELGHCLQDGYGVPVNIPEGRRLLIKANARELSSSIRSLLSSPPQPQQNRRLNHHPNNTGARNTMSTVWNPLLSDFACNVPTSESHPVNRFLKEWFESGRGVLGPELTLCSYIGCGKPETRPREFRRCSVCGVVNYCSRGCQTLDWKVRHRMTCIPVDRWAEENGVVGGDMVEVEDL